MTDEDPFTYRTYRVEFRTVVRAVDQYGQRMRGEELFYMQAWPTLAAAEADRQRIARPHPHVTGRWESPLAPSSFHEVAIDRVETLVSNHEPAERQPEPDEPAPFV